MKRLPVHEPPPAPVVAELISAGVSLSTALAMEQWKAREVLDLLRGLGRADLTPGPPGPARGTI